MVVARSVDEEVSAHLTRGCDVEHPEQGAFQSQVVEFTPMGVTQKAQAEIEALQIEVDSLKGKVASLEDIVSDVIARNCLLMKPLEPVVEAGESHSADAVA